MHKEDPKVAKVESPPRLECTGIWGGIRNRDIEITAGKVIGSIYSAACCEGGKGGDIYYFGVCKGDLITRLAIADVVGHGEVVSEVSQYVYDSLKAHM
jgi:phosphoserine phosphatase RsbU/P